MNLILFSESSAKTSPEGATSTISSVANTNVTQNLSAMTTTTNAYISAQGYLQLPANLSSHSSSAKSIGSKSSDGSCTGKKRKILSSGQQKKFRRHFKQLPLDEEVLNCTYLAF